MTYSLYTEHLDAEQHEEFDRMLLGDEEVPKPKVVPPAERKSQNVQALMASFRAQR